MKCGTLETLRTSPKKMNAHISEIIATDVSKSWSNNGRISGIRQVRKKKIVWHWRSPENPETKLLWLSAGWNKLRLHKNKFKGQLIMVKIQLVMIFRSATIRASMIHQSPQRGKIYLVSEATHLQPVWCWFYPSEFISLPGGTGNPVAVDSWFPFIGLMLSQKIHRWL